MDLNPPDGPGLAFLLEVFDRSSGDPSKSVSMFVVGESLGWERELASRTAQDLMGLGLIEIRTLSGGVGLSAAGAEAVNAARALAASPNAPMGRGPVMTPVECRLAEDASARVRTEAAANGRLSPELEADLRTLAAQIASPRPKTAIVCACLRSMLDALDPAAHAGRAAIRALLGE